MSSPSPYRVLGIGQAATSAEVRQAYQRALRASVHPKSVVRDAFTRLKNPRTRAVADLLEPEPFAATARLSEAVAAEAAVPLVDATTAPSPSWSSLVAPRMAGPAEPARELPPPTGEFPEGRDLASPTSAVVPPPELPL